MHIKSVAEAQHDEGHLPCSYGFTATGSGAPQERIPCSTTATFFSSDPVLGLQITQWLTFNSMEDVYWVSVLPISWQKWQEDPCLKSSSVCFKIKVVRIPVSFFFFLGKFQCFLMLEMPLRWVPLNSLNLLSGEQGWKGISSIARRNSSHCVFVIKYRNNENLATQNYVGLAA